MNKKISLGAAITFVIIAAAVTFSITTIYSMRKFNDMMYSIREREVMYKKFSEIDKKVRQSFYGTIDEDRLMDAVARGYINGLGDDAGHYMTAAEYEASVEAADGKMIGIGVEAIVGESGYLRITRVYPESTAAAAELQVDDLIIRLGEVDITPENAEEMLAMLEGDEGTKLSLVIRRGNEDLPEMELTRRSVEIPSVQYRLLEGGIGQIFITSFKSSTTAQFSAAVDTLKNQGAQALVLDVRNNSVGTVRATAEILDILLPAGDMFSVTYNDGTAEVLAASDSAEIELPMVVLVNEGTSGMAELFAKTIRDFGKGQIVGSKTAGQATMQSVMELDDGSALALTVGLYHPPSGESFNKTGIKPDYETALSSELTLLIEYLDETLDTQLGKAVEVVRGSLKAAEIEGNAVENGEGSGGDEDPEE